MVDGAEPRIGAYRIEKLLGRGGMGEVYLAYDERLERRVALKRVRGDANLDLRLRERFRREARAAARLSHPAVVQVHDILEDGSGDCIVLEYVEGRTLASVLAAGPPETGLALRLAREIAEGLAHAHEQGLLHRDLKAQNVIVTPAGHAKILDFGLAKPILTDDEDTLTAHGTVLGTFHSMSPEQATGRDLDERSDLFSLGVLIYEVLTGRSPFKAPSAAETLGQILHHEPPPISRLRPDLPPELSELVARLLAKDRDLRPRSALEVARTLERAAQAPTLPTAPGFPQTGLSELPTGPALAQSRVTRGRPIRSRALVVVLVAGAVAAAASLLLNGLNTAPLRILVPSPAVTGPADDRLSLVASGVLSSVLSSLSSLEGIAPLEPSQLGGTGSSPEDLARSSAADEVLLASVAGEGEMARVSLKRVQGSDGRVLWAETFQVPAGPRDLALMADAVRVHLQHGYPDHSPRSGTPDLDARSEDYLAFLEVKQRVDSGKTSWEPELERIEQVALRSPRFLEAWLLGSRVALTLFQGTRETAYLDRARRMVREARGLAPNDPRPLIEAFRNALAAQRHEEVPEILEELERLLPGDPELLVLRASLAEQTGRTDEAFALLHTAVERAPSWKNLYRLSDLESRNGRMAEARQHLGRLLDRSPDNFFALEKLAGMELLTGDLDQAERLYQRLLALSPQRSHYNNLGLARSLLGRHEEAVAAYRKALEMDPNHMAVLLNLADAESALGHREEADRLYRRILEGQEGREAATAQPADRMVPAQCLVRLGRTREAVEIAQRTLQQHPDDPEVVYLAALVYSLAGDRSSALVNARIAREKGTQPRWFTLAAFDPLRDDPEFRSLLEPDR
ncbi:MAG TPA: tetratricopeptide repeat protein [Thermoanaerobaculia bacterium]|nr:tetratricopeptide repeat protein [Thermoanaerobaculia bacterium]